MPVACEVMLPSRRINDSKRHFNEPSLDFLLADRDMNLPTTLGFSLYLPDRADSGPSKEAPQSRRSFTGSLAGNKPSIVPDPSLPPARSPRS